MKQFWQKCKKICKKNWQWPIIFCLALTFFLGTSAYNQKVRNLDENFIKWGSPDETANYTFAKLYGETGDLRIFEKYNLIAGDIIHPRSFRSDHGDLKPVSFLGIILIYGFLVSLSASNILPFLTPAFAALEIVFFYLLVQKIFNRRIAFLSAFFLASFPPFIYYSARSMFHNILFTALLIAGFYFGILMARTRLKNTEFISWQANWLGFFYSALAGALIGLAIITRSSELLWLFPVLIFLWIFNIKKIGLFKLICFLGFLVLSILPAAYWNQALYGAFWAGGYPAMNNSIANIAQAGGELAKTTAVGDLAYHKELFSKIKDNVFYFGFSARDSLRMFYYYFIDMFWWIFWPALFGAILWLQNIYNWPKKQIAYLVALGVSGLILIFYYGSWEFHDNPDFNSFSIGNSYTRYWLPLYIGLMPLACLFLIRFTRALFPRQSKPRENLLERKKGYLKRFWQKYIQRPKRMFLTNSSRALFLILIYFISFSFILHGSEEGLVYSLEKSKKAKQEFEKVINLTESNSLIITRYHDKLLFPERKVIVGLFDDAKMNAYYAKLVEYIPVYYYNFSLPTKDLEYLNSRRLAEVGLKIKEIEKIGDFSLYSLEK